MTKEANSFDQGYADACRHNGIDPDQLYKAAQIVAPPRVFEPPNVAETIRKWLAQAKTYMPQKPQGLRGALGLSQPEKTAQAFEQGYYGGDPRYGGGIGNIGTARQLRQREEDGPSLLRRTGAGMFRGGVGGAVVGGLAGGVLGAGGQVLNNSNRPEASQLSGGESIKEMLQYMLAGAAVGAVPVGITGAGLGGIMGAVNKTAQYRDRARDKDRGFLGGTIRGAGRGAVAGGGIGALIGAADRGVQYHNMTKNPLFNKLLPTDQKERTKLLLQQLLAGAKGGAIQGSLAGAGLGGVVGAVA